jgi:hypothetical protein
MDGSSEKRRSQGQKNSGLFLTQTKMSISKSQMNQWYQMKLNLIKGKYERPAVAVAGETKELSQRNFWNKTPGSFSNLHKGLDCSDPDLLNKVPNEFWNFVLIPSPRELLLNIRSHSRKGPKRGFMLLKISFLAKLFCKFFF